jgi:hypothetical protein
VSAQPRARRIWSELLPHAHLCERGVLRLLAEREISLIVAVTPEDEPTLAAVMESAGEAGVSAGIWPMLDRRDGRWPNALNVEAYAGFVERVLERLDAARLRPATLAVDLEPPIDELRGVFDRDVRMAWRWARRGGLGAARRAFATLVSRARASGIETIAAAIPSVIGLPLAARGWQRALGTPIDGVPFDRVSPMFYTSMIQGYARGLLGREDTLAALALVARSTRARLGDRASLSLGAVGPGILGDEPTLRSVGELAEDVAEARAAGIDDLALFDLAGVIARGPPEPWLDAFVGTEPASRSRPLTVRAAIGVGATVAAGTTLEAAAHASRALAAIRRRARARGRGRGSLG